MKKIMIAVAIVCATVAAQAATFAWTSASYSYFADSTGTKVTTEGVYNTALNGGSIVLVYLGTTDAYSWDGATVLSSSTISGTTASLRTSAPAAKKGLVEGSFKFSYDDDTKIRNGAVFGVMFEDSTGALSKLVYVDNNGNKGAEIETTYTVSGLTDDTWSGDNFTFTTAGTSSAPNNFTAVPEPTSGLLMLLGMAGLALKRKRA